MRPNREPDEGAKLHVGNLSYDTDVAEIEYRFGRFGKLTDVYIPMDNYSGRSKGFAFVTFEDVRDAQDALRDMDGIDIDGRRVIVEVAKPRRRAPPRGYGGGGYRGGGRRGRDSRDNSRDRGRRRDRSPRRRSYDRNDSRGRSADRGDNSAERGTSADGKNDRGYSRD